MMININTSDSKTQLLYQKQIKMAGTKRYPFCLLIIFLLLVQFHSSLVLSEKNRKHYIVHIDQSLMPKAFSSQNSWHSSIINALKSTDSRTSDDNENVPRLVYSYVNALHGFSAVLSEEELEALKKSPGFVSAYADKLGTFQTTHTTQFLSLNPITGLWPASELGKDVIIGVIDSGVWPESPSYNDDGMTAIPAKWKGTCETGQDFNSSMCNLKLIGAQNFNKGFIAANPNVTVDMNSTRDTFGHGTHTSSMVAGNYVEDASFFGYALGTARGVAPRARVAMYKVGSLQGLYSSDVIAGIDQAVADGVDIISISIAFSSTPLYEDAIAIASFGAMENGVLFSCAGGNSGPHLGTALNGIPWALSTAAGTIDRSFAGTLTLGNGQIITGWTLFPARAVIQDLPLVYNKTISSCNSSELLSKVDGIVICVNPDFFRIQINISKSTVPATIFFSDDPDIYLTTRFLNPGVVLGTKYQQDVINYAVTDANPSASISFQETILGTTPAPAVASYSSRGPAPSCPGILKPDILAPGTLVLAAWLPNVPVANIGKINLSNNFKLVTGTSMACPHSSAIAALLKGAHPEWSPAAIRSAMMTTAHTLDNTQSPIKDIGFDYDVASPLAMGAGFVNPNKALDPGLVYDASTQDYINFLCSMNFTKSQITTIVRSSSFNCSNTSEADLNYPSFIALYHKGNTSTITKEFKRTVTNVGNGGETYKVMVTSPKGSTVSVNPETLNFVEQYEKQSYSLTIHYAGDTNGTVQFGSVTWFEVRGKYSVRSPVVVSPIFSV